MLAPWKRQSRWREISEKLSRPVKNELELDGRMSYISRPRLTAKKVCKRLELYFRNGAFNAKTVFDKIIPVIDSLVLEAPKTLKTLDFLPVDTTCNIAYTRKEIATIIALMWYDLFDYDYMMVDGKEVADIDNYGQPNLHTIWNNDNNFCLDCIFNYFYRISELEDEYTFDVQKVIYRRYCPDKKISYAKCKFNMPPILAGTGDSDRSSARLHICGASSRVGGRGFAGTLTQEEITMLSRPECIALLLLAPSPAFAAMNVVIGAEQMSLHRGLGATVSFEGNYDENLVIAGSLDLIIYQTANVFVPPSCATSTCAQFLRDFDGDVKQLQHAMESALLQPGARVSFGNWNYDLNGSPPRLRVIQACIAAGAAQMELCLYIADPDTAEQLPDFVDWLQNKTVSDVYTVYRDRVQEEWDSQGIHLGGIDHIRMMMDV